MRLLVVVVLKQGSRTTHFDAKLDHPEVSKPRAVRVDEGDRKSNEKSAKSRISVQSRDYQSSVNASPRASVT